MVTIKNGPSKQQLFESFVRHCSGTETNVSFIANDGFEISGVVTLLQYEDGSGQSFNFGGYFNEGRYLKGYYHVGIRSGCIDMERR